MDPQFHHFSITNFTNKNKLLNPCLSPIIQRMMLFSISDAEHQLRCQHIIGHIKSLFDILKILKP